MNKRRTLLREAGIVLVLVALFLAGAAPARAMSGREVYEKVHAVRVNSLDRTTAFSMTLFDKGGSTRGRTGIEYSRRGEGEAYKVLVLFETPADLRDVGFLVHARNFAERDLWAYFPEMKRIRRIPTTSQDDSFFGSDFSYDDFGGPPDLDDYSFAVLGEEAVDGRPCYVVEVTPENKRKWSRYVAWVDKEHFIHLKLEFYQDREKYRAGTFRSVQVVDGVPTPFLMEMENVRTGHRTELTITKIQYHTSHPDELFTQRALERAGR